MSEPASAHASLSATGYADGLGRRTLEFDRESGGMLERLHLRAEFGVFEAGLRQRIDRIAPFEDARFARVRAVERDSGGLSVLSTYVAGDRLCDLLDAATNLPAHEATSPSVDAALGFLLEALSALEAFHSATGMAHGAVAPGRIALTPSGQVVLLDTIYGHALERLQFNRRRLWTQFGLAIPAAAGATRFDVIADVSQASLAAMMIVLGRPFRENDYPDALPDLITEVIEIAQIRGSSRFASDLHKFLHRSLPLPARRAHASAEEAAAEVRQVVREIGAQRCRAALTAFVSDTNRVIADARGQRILAHDPAIEIPFAPTPDVTFDDPIVAPPIADAEPSFERGEYSITAPLAQPADEPATTFDAIESVTDFVDESTAAAPAPLLEEATVPYPLPELEPVRAIVPEPAVSAVVVEEVLTPLTDEARPADVEPAAASTPAEEPPQPALPVERESEPTAAESKRARRNARRHRDRLRSNATPPPPPLPPPPAPPARSPLIPSTPAFAAVMPLPSVAPPAPPARKIAQPLREEAPLAAPPPPMRAIAPVPVEPPAAAPQPIAPLGFKSDPVPFKSDPVPFRTEATVPFKSGSLTFKNDPPSGFSPSSLGRAERREPQHIDYVPFNQRTEREEGRKFPWRLAAAAMLVIGVGIGAGWKYLPSNSTAAAAAPTPSKEVVAAAKMAEAAEKTGTLVLTTEPAGAHVLLDGKEMGDSPLTLENVPAGKHALTFVTASASVKRIIRVEAGKTAALDVAVFSGWIAVYSPIPLDIAENGRAIGSSEQGRLMLSPGRHQLTLSNTELGYSSVKTVDIEPGEEHPVSVQPTGELSANAVPWAEVWMDGKKIGETPTAHLIVPLGTHEVVFKNPDHPDRRVTVTVSATAPVTASVDFSK
jgi:hypothetical protein